jgi:broad specificity phosphatase PhoE
MRYVFLMALLLVNATSSLFGALDVIIIRHGQADHNIHDTRNADPKNPHYVVSNLTQKGKEQAVDIAFKLKGEKINPSLVKAVYVSPLPRCIETARIIMNALGITQRMTIDQRITERNVGDLEGKPFFPISDRTARQHGGEAQEDIKKRVTSFYDYLAKTYHTGTVLIITHDSIAKTLCRLISGHSCRIATGCFIRFTLKPKTKIHTEL